MLRQLTPLVLLATLLTACNVTLTQPVDPASPPNATLPVDAAPSVTQTSRLTGTVLFESDRDGNWEIYALDLASGDLTNLTNDPANDRDPTWSPDGMRLAFASDRDERFEIYAMNFAEGEAGASGGEAEKLTTNSVLYDRQPRWTPDGTQIAFMSQRNRSHDTWQVYVDDPGNIIKYYGGVEWMDTYAPDGVRVLALNVDGVGDIYVEDTVNGGYTNLTNTPDIDEQQPRWSADYTQIVYAANALGDFDIYTASFGEMSLGTPVQLTRSPATDQYPAWRPE